MRGSIYTTLPSTPWSSPMPQSSIYLTSYCRELSLSRVLQCQLLLYSYCATCMYMRSGFFCLNKPTSTPSSTLHYSMICSNSLPADALFCSLCPFGFIALYSFNNSLMGAWERDRVTHEFSLPSLTEYYICNLGLQYFNSNNFLCSYME